MVSIARRDYAALYGPTVGDGVRLADTSLVAVVEKDDAVYGDECLHGGGKTLRDGIGLAAGVTSAQGALDLLLCNVLVIDPVIGMEALLIPPENLRAVMIAEPELGDRIMRALILRRVVVIETGAGGPVLIGPEDAP